MSIVQNIKVACIRNGTNFTELERALDFPRGTIYRWDDHKPVYDRVVSVAKILKCTVDSLVIDEGE